MSEKRAEWRLNPVAEREIAQDRRRERRCRWNVGIMVFAGLGVGPFACLGSCLPVGYRGDGGILAFLWFSAIFGFGFGVLRYARDAALGRTRQLALAKEFSEVAGWLVEMTIHQGEVVSGRDVGVVWLEGGRLYFTGARTSFGLGPGDVRGKVLPGGSLLDLGPHVVLPLRAESIVGPVSVGLRFTSPEPLAASPASDETTFRMRLQGWTTGEATRGQLPPLSVGADLPSDWSLRARAVVASATWIGFFLLIFIHQWLGAALFAILFSVLWAPVRSPRRCWRAIRDRRRLEAYNRD